MERKDNDTGGIRNRNSGEIRIGDIVGGKYRIKRKIASGGMADVYEAEQITLRRKVALKVLKENMVNDEEAKTMFYREAQMVAQELDHPNIVKIYDFGEHKGRFYIVMYFVNGVTLRDYIKEKKRLPVSEALKITLDVLKALDFAHRKGIVHRDIKPGNIMLSTDGKVYLLDFGIADIIMGSGERPKRIPGTPEYMAPEQFKGKWDHRSDLYSLGIVLYEMLTGKTPFHLDENDWAYIKKKSQSQGHEKNESLWVLQKKIFSQQPPPPSQLNPEVPKEVDELVLKAINKMPSERFQSAVEFMKAIVETGLVDDSELKIDELQQVDENQSSRGGLVFEEEVSGSKITQFLPIDEEEEAEFEFKEIEAGSGRSIGKILFLLGIVLLVLLILGGIWFAMTRLF